MSDSGSIPPPSLPPPADGDPAAKAAPRTITLKLDHAPQRGAWRKKLAGRGHDANCHVRLVGSKIVFEHPGALRSPLTIAAGLVAIAAVDHGSSDASDRAGRFPILRRISPTAVVPQSEGVEGWLWTARSGSALPMLGEGAPNLALVFGHPLEEKLVEGVFQPGFLAALVQHSPLGAPTVFGLLVRVIDATAAENAFTELGVIGPVTDREVAPARRRHLQSDAAANPSVGPLEDHRQDTSVPPPGAGRRGGDRRGGDRRAG